MDSSNPNTLNITPAQDSLLEQKLDELSHASANTLKESQGRLTQCDAMTSYLGSPQDEMAMLSSKLKMLADQYFVLRGQLSENRYDGQLDLDKLGDSAQEIAQTQAQILVMETELEGVYMISNKSLVKSNNERFDVGAFSKEIQGSDLEAETERPILSSSDAMPTAAAPEPGSPSVSPHSL